MFIKKSNQPIKVKNPKTNKIFIIDDGWDIDLFKSKAKGHWFSGFDLVGEIENPLEKIYED